jgi:Glycosyl transferases group 1
VGCRVAAPSSPFLSNPNCTRVVASIVTAKSFRLCQVHLGRDAPSETFVRATAERLPCPCRSSIGSRIAACAWTIHRCNLRSRWQSSLVSRAVETGFLVEERDVEGMARQMTRLVLDPGLAAELGRAGRRRMQESFSIDSRIARLWEIIRASAPA